MHLSILFILFLFSPISILDIAVHDQIPLEEVDLVDSDSDLQDRSVRIAGMQMEVSTEINVNKRLILAGIIEAQKQDVDFLMTPEGSLSGYNDTFDGAELLVALDEVMLAAKRAKVGLILGTCYKEKDSNADKCWNQIRVYAPTGELLVAYSKILRCSSVDEPGTGEMLDYEEGELATFRWNDIEFGPLVCNDLWATPGYTTMSNPYLPLQLKQMGAEVLLHAINSGKNLKYKPFHESSVELWAESLGVHIVEVNAAKGESPINARSGLINPTGERTVDVESEGSQFFVLDINLPGSSK